MDTANTRETFGTLLASLRAKQGVGIKVMAPAVGVNYTYLSKLENDRATPSDDLVQRLAQYFRYDADILMLMAGRVPPATLEILRRNPNEAIALLREKFASVGQGTRPATESHRGKAHDR